MERYAFRFPSDAGTITANSANTRFPASNLLDPRLAGVVTKTLGAAASEWWQIDLGAEYYISGFALLGHNFTNAYSGLAVKGDVTSPIPGSPVLDHAVTFRDGSLIEFFTAQLVRYVRFNFTKPSAGTIAQAARILFFQTSEQSNGSINRTWTKESLSNVARPRTGQVYADIGAKPRRLSLTYPMLSQAEKEEMETMLDYGMDYPFLYSVDHEYEPTSWLIYGTVTNSPTFTQLVPRGAAESVSDVPFSADIEITESL